MENINFKASLTAPNPLEVIYWVDLTEDSQGGAIKHYDFSSKTWKLIKAQTEVQDNSQIIADINLLKSNKVDKIAGKSLSDNNYSAAEKSKLEGLSNYNDSNVRSLITALTARVTALETA